MPNLSYIKIIKALQRHGWTVVRQRGSHIRLQKHIRDEVLKITVPAHRPVKRSTLSRILKEARLELEDFLDLLWNKGSARPRKCTFSSSPFLRWFICFRTTGTPPLCVGTRLIIILRFPIKTKSLDHPPSLISSLGVPQAFSTSACQNGYFDLNFTF